MSNKNRNYIDDMVDLFGYDYVIGYCLCSEYDLLKKAKKEEDAEKAKHLKSIAKKYSMKADQLVKERYDYGL